MSDDPSSSKVPVAVLEYEPSAFEHKLLKHKSKLILVGVLGIAGTVAYWGYRLYSEASHKSAAVDFVRAGSVQELKAVAENHTGKPGAGNALVLAADKLSADNPKDAIALLQDYLSKFPDHPLRDLAAWRIAEYHSRAGDAAAAEKAYNEVVAAGTAYSAFALLRLGDAQWAAGDTAKAKEFYDKILNNGAMSGSPVRTLAKNRVEKSLKAKPPVLVEYKEDPPPPPPPSPGAGAPGSLIEPGALLPAPVLPQLPDQPMPEPVPAPAVPAAPAETPAVPAGEAAKPAEVPAAPAAEAVKPAAPEAPAAPAADAAKPAEPAKPAEAPAAPAAPEGNNGK